MATKKTTKKDPKTATAPTPAPAPTPDPLSIEGKGIEGRAVVLKAESFPNLDVPARVFMPSGGFGCSAFTSGSAVFGTFTGDGEECRVERYSVERFATPEEVAEAEKRAQDRPVCSVCGARMTRPDLITGQKGEWQCPLIDEEDKHPEQRMGEPPACPVCGLPMGEAIEVFTGKNKWVCRGSEKKPHNDEELPGPALPRPVFRHWQIARMVAQVAESAVATLEREAGLTADEARYRLRKCFNNGTLATLEGKDEKPQGLAAVFGGE